MGPERDRTVSMAVPDLAAVMDAASTCADPHERAHQVLLALEHLVSCDVVFWHWFRVGPARRTFALEFGSATHEPMPPDAWLVHMHEHPIMSGRYGDVVSFRDVLSPAARRRTWMWQQEGDVHPVDEIGVQLPHASDERNAVSFTRYAGPPFDERDHLVLRLLRPHLAAALAHGTEPRSGLTARQVQVLRLVREGCTDRQIARRLGCAEATVSKHLEAAYARLGARSRAHAVAIAGSELDGPLSSPVRPVPSQRRPLTSA